MSICPLTLLLKKTINQNQREKDLISGLKGRKNQPKGKKDISLKLGLVLNPKQRRQREYMTNSNNSEIRLCRCLKSNISIFIVNLLKSKIQMCHSRAIFLWCRIMLNIEHIQGKFVSLSTTGVVRDTSEIGTKALLKELSEGRRRNLETTKLLNNQ